MILITRINFSFALNSLLALFISGLLLHALILFSLIPYDIVWGGQLKTVLQMRVFESISIGITILIILVVAVKGKYLKQIIPTQVVTFILWLMLALCLMNTIGNIFSDNIFEVVIFTPITLISALFFYRLIIESE